jgi:hypothetical protein
VAKSMSMMRILSQKTKSTGLEGRCSKLAKAKE